MIDPQPAPQTQVVASQAESRIQLARRWPGKSVGAAVVLAGLTLLVIGLQFSYLRTVSTSIPHQDEWMLLDAMFQSFDSNNVVGWLFHSRNGHFGLTGKLSYLLSLQFFSLDLAPLRFLNFPVCLLGLVLSARVVMQHVSQPAIRWCVISGAALLLFNLCMWEHFSQGSAFATILAAVIGGAGLYYVVRALYAERARIKNLTVAFVWIIFAILSFGIGYAALAAAFALVTLWLSKRLIGTQPVGWSRPAILGAAAVAATLALLSHPLLNLGLPLRGYLYHFLLVAGAIWASPFENPPLAQKIAYICGLAVFSVSLYALADFVTSDRRRAEGFRAFGIAIILFGLGACAAVAAARPGLPEQEFLSSRYTLQTSIAALGLLFYFATKSRVLLGQLWSFVAIGYLFATVEEWQTGPFRPAVYESIEATVRRIETVPDAELASSLYWNEDLAPIRRVATRLERDRLNVFRNDR
ncbi:MAG: hypothetical protein AVDCRST_MAG42-2110 [uncultured Chthoniobacterales bacterium]|uniref:Uncharacterized protein n=1 Tax=uncultured Chthoniobacterales bacterium TaxID=1836801 RepID=A0A6J4I7Y1_9BACT|nr:MAG: hypothetical protein AVDCRST_MAG42-2110 [uncultured Chthoniobacterales bacterium]